MLGFKSLEDATVTASMLRVFKCLVVNTFLFNGMQWKFILQLLAQIVDGPQASNWSTRLTRV